MDVAMPNSIASLFRTARHDLIAAFYSSFPGGTPFGGSAGAASTPARPPTPATGSSIPPTSTKAAGAGNAATQAAVNTLLRHEIRFQVHIRKQIAKAWRAMQNKVCGCGCGCGCALV